MSAVLRTYVEQLASRPHEWPSHFRFFPVPLPAASPLPQLVRSLCALDASYAAAFGEAIEASNLAAFLTRLKLYLFHAKANHGMPIGECMLCKGKKPRRFSRSVVRFAILFAAEIPDGLEPLTFFVP